MAMKSPALAARTITKANAFTRMAISSSRREMRAASDLHANIQISVNEGKFRRNEQHGSIALPGRIMPVALSPRKMSALEQLQTVGRRKAVKRDVPSIRRNRFAEPLDRPTHSDESRTILLQADQRPIIMTLAATEPSSLAVDRDERDEKEIGLHDRMAPRRLHDSEWSG